MLRPRLHEGTYGFCAVPAGAAVPASAIAMFREREGVSVIVPTAEANAIGLSTAMECAWLTLEVPSPLDAVGLTAAVARALTDEGIPCNVVAALHHDHLFVPVGRGRDALAALQRLSAHG